TALSAEFDFAPHRAPHSLFLTVGSGDDADGAPSGEKLPLLTERWQDAASDEEGASDGAAYRFTSERQKGSPVDAPLDGHRLSRGRAPLQVDALDLFRGRGPTLAHIIEQPKGPPVMGRIDRDDVPFEKR